MTIPHACRGGAPKRRKVVSHRIRHSPMLIYADCVLSCGHEASVGIGSILRNRRRPVPKMVECKECK